jgi:hypothetical protein
VVFFAPSFFISPDKPSSPSRRSANFGLILPGQFFRFP